MGYCAVQAQPVNMGARAVQTVWGLDVAPVGARALTLWGGNTVLMRGALVAPDAVFLVFGPQCSNVVFRDVSFKGALPTPAGMDTGFTSWFHFILRRASAAVLS